MPKFLVTGGAGFIGAHIVTRLVKEGHTVVVFDNLSTGKKQNLTEVAQNIVFITGDIRDRVAVDKAMAGVDYVFHEAAITSVTQSIDDPLTTMAVNETGTLHVLLAARDHGVKRVVFASSSAVYGSAARQAAREANVPRPLSPYGISKLTGEHYCRVFSELYELPTVCLRYFNVFGPRQNSESGYAAVVPVFLRQLLRGQALTIHGRGRQTRDFTYVGNVVEANIKALNAAAPGGEIFNIGSGKKTTINQLATQLQKLTGIEGVTMYQPKRSGDIFTSYASITKAKRGLGYTPLYSLPAGLAETIDWYRQQPL